METLHSLLVNLGLLSLAALLVLIAILKLNLPVHSHRRAIIAGTIYGLASVLVVSFPITGPFGYSVDTRAAPVLIATYYTGPIGGFIAATLGAIARFSVGGPHAMAGAFSFYVYAASALAFRWAFARKPLNTVQLLSLSLISTVTILPLIFIGQPFEEGWAAFVSFWHVLFIGNIMGTVLLGLLVKVMRDLNSARREYDAIIATSLDGIITVDTELRICSMNSTASNMFGWPNDEILGKNINCLVPESLHKKHTPQAINFVKDQKTEYRQMTGFRIIEGTKKNGDTFPVLISLAKYLSNGKTMVAATVHDMTEIKESRDKLEQMTETLAARLGQSNSANAAKNMFLANMSHELRTPLNAIIGFAGFLESLDLTRLSHKKILEYVRDIKISGETLHGMINDVLDISKIESEKLEFNIAPTPVSEIFEGSIRFVRFNADQHNIKITVNGDTNLIVPCDLRATTQAITNLLSNAIKFSPEESEILVSAKQNSDYIELSVSDQGVGMPDDVISRIGEPFLRGTTPELRQTKGTGLGLALSKKLIEKQYGELTFSRLESSGTLAKIRFPI